MFAHLYYTNNLLIERGSLVKTKVMFFFDTADFTSPEGADAILALVRLLDEEGVTGHFAVVGLLAEQLTHWKRDDIKRLLRNHIIGTHTYGHSLLHDADQL